MSISSFEKYFSQFPVRVYKKHWSIVNPGDNLRTIYYLKRGYVRLYSMSPDGKELTLIVYKSGDFFPLFVALTSKQPYRYWIETMSSSEVISVPVDSFKAFFKNNPDLLFDLSVRIMARLDTALRRMEYLAFGSAPQRLSSLLLILGERFGKKEKKGMYIEAPFTHKDLANLSGLTRETVSAIMSDLKKEGLIDSKNQHVTIKDRTKLTKRSLLDNLFT